MLFDFFLFRIAWHSIERLFKFRAHTDEDSDSVLFFDGKVFDRNAKQERKYINEIAFCPFSGNRLHIRSDFG